MQRIDPAPGPEMEAVRADAARHVQRVLETFPFLQRSAIELAYFGDLSDQAIAGRMRVPLGSVKSWKRRGLNRLATMLGEETP